MISISDGIKQLYKAVNTNSVNKNYKISIDNGAVQLQNSDLVYGSFKLEHKLCSSDTLTFGECNAAMVQFKCAVSIGDVKGKELVLQQEINSNTVNLGRFTIDSCEITENRKYRTITAYDNIYRFNINVSEWYDNLSFPVSMINLFKSLCTYVGVSHSVNSLINGTLMIDKTVSADDMQGITVLKCIAELNGGFFRADENGIIEFVRLSTDEIKDEIEVNLYSSLKKEDYKTQLYDRLNIRSQYGDIGVTSGDGDNAYIIQDNFLIYGKKSEVLKPVADRIFNTIKSISYVPFSCTQLGLPYLQTGDYVKYITVSGSFCSLILSRTLTGTQVLRDKFETKGTEKTNETFGLEKEIIKLKGRSNVLTRSIEETKEEITNLETDINENYSTTAETLTEITKTAGEIKSTVEATYTTKEEFNNLEIGGRNLAAGTAQEYKTVSIGRYYTTIQSIPMSDLVEKYGLHDGDYITFSVYIKANSEKQLCSMIQHHNSNEDRTGKNGTYIENKEGMSYVTTQLNTSYTTLQLCIRNVTNTITETTRESYKCIKLEKGTKATDWTPSPEDVDSKITTLSTNYTKLDQSLTGLTAEVAGNTSTIATKADNSTVTEIQNNLTTVTADLNGFKTTVSSTYTTKQEFNNLEIGGRNLIINSKLEIGYINSNGTITTSNNYRVTDYIKVNAGDNLIFQAWGNFVTRGWWDITHFDENKTYIGGYGNAYWDLGTHYIQESNIVPDGTAYIRLSFTTPSESGMVKLEKGTKPTDWTPSPEDVDSSIEAVDTHLTTVEQTADKINWIVKSGSSQSDFTLTDRLAELTAEIISLNANVKVNGSMIVDGAITAKKIATDAIKSRNYIKDKYGSYLNLTNGSFDSPLLKFTQSMLQMGSVHISTETDDYGKVKGGIYLEFVNSDTGTIGGHGEVYRLYMNPYTLDSGDSGKAIQLTKHNAYDMSVIDTIFRLNWGGYVMLKNTLVCQNMISATNGFTTSQGGITANNGYIQGSRLIATGNTYPNIYGNGTYLHLNHSNGNTKGLVLQEDSIRPAGDNTQVLGNSTHRWGVIYSISSGISTSDAREKKEIEKLDRTIIKEFLKNIAAVSYKFINGTSDRKHFGMISQQIEEVMKRLGINSKDFAGFIKSPKEEEYTETETDENGEETEVVKSRIIENEYRYGLRYEEFIAPLITGWQMHDDEIETLKQENKELKEKLAELQNAVETLINRA